MGRRRRRPAADQRRARRTETTRDLSELFLEREDADNMCATHARRRLEHDLAVRPRGCTRGRVHQRDLRRQGVAGVDGRRPGDRGYLCRPVFSRGQTRSARTLKMWGAGGVFGLRTHAHDAGADDDGSAARLVDAPGHALDLGRGFMGAAKEHQEEGGLEHNRQTWRRRRSCAIFNRVVNRSLGLFVRSGSCRERVGGLLFLWLPFLWLLFLWLLFSGYCFSGCCFSGYCFSGYCFSVCCFSGYCFSGYCFCGYCFSGRKRS